MSAALSIKNLSKTFGTNTVLRGVDLELGYGEIHGLLGENGSGKSTLIKVLAGFHEPDAGADVKIGGQQLSFPLKPGAFRALGLSFVHQDLGLVPDISIAENLFVAQIANGRGRLSRRAMADEARGILDQYGIVASANDPVSRLGPADRSRLAIARALREVATDNRSHHVLILDEPTSAMGLSDKQALYATLRALAGAGIALLLVSHDLDEIMEVTHKVTVLRDGVGVSVDTSSTSPQEIIRMIVGRSVAAAARRPMRTPGPERLRAIDIQSRAIEALSLTLAEGEVIGVTGLLGSGYDSVNQVLFGATASVAGELAIKGAPIELARYSPSVAIDHGMAFVPLERDHKGIVMDLSVADNISVQLLGSREARGRGALISRSYLDRNARQGIETYRIRAPGPRAQMNALSGGNRQKVLLARWLIADSSTLLLDEPTQAVDIGAHEEILEVIDAYARAGGSVIISSADWGQLAAACDRVLIFGAGKVHTILAADNLTKNSIGEACYRAASRQAQAAASGSGGSL